MLTQRAPTAYGRDGSCRDQPLMLAIILVLLAAATNAAALVLLRKATEAEKTPPGFSLRLLWLLVRRRPGRT